MIDDLIDLNGLIEEFMLVCEADVSDEFKCRLLLFHTRKRIRPMMERLGLSLENVTPNCGSPREDLEVLSDELRLVHQSVLEIIRPIISELEDDSDED